MHAAACNVQHVLKACWHLRWHGAGSTCVLLKLHWPTKYHPYKCSQRYAGQERPRAHASERLCHRGPGAGPAKREAGKTGQEGAVPILIPLCCALCGKVRTVEPECQSAFLVALQCCAYMCICLLQACRKSSIACLLIFDRMLPAVQVTVRYKGTHKGKVFDESKGKGFSFRLGEHPVLGMGSLECVRGVS